jgi:hypothetical protein
MSNQTTRKVRGNPDKIKGQGFHTNPERINRKGRPKELPDLKELLIEVLTEENKNISGAKAILIGLRNKAIQGDSRAAEILLDRGYGRIVQHIDATIRAEQPLFGDADLEKKLPELEA